MADQTLHSMTEDTDPTTTAELYLLEDPSGTPLNRRITAANLLKVTNNLTQDTAPIGTTDFVATYDASAAGMKKVLLNRLGTREMEAAFNNFSPADATTYYFGEWGVSLAPSTTAAIRRVYVGKPGVLRSADIHIRTATVLGSSTNSTMSFRLNNTSDTTIASTIDLSSDEFHILTTGLSVTLAAGDYFEIKWVTPTWATNPTGVFCSVRLLIDNA